MTMGCPSGWNGERETLLRQLWPSPLSASQISREFMKIEHFQISRAGVIGKAYRLKLVKPKPEKSARPRRRRASTPKLKVYIPKPRVDLSQPVVIIADSDIPLSQRKTLMELTDTTCRFPIGEVGHGLFFCGGPADLLGGQPYCCAHMVRAYPPAQAREKAA